ncbi:MAG: DUF4124 domain-containing protein [Sedimenticola sp.]|uniref:DUF4124 domain-containing protein n=1 Tax=Sedimenticola thiotaurini TaxID=1543721 RepID=A0A558DG50_9GAMM|nr:DUF4124 domain-containing protein [Sedimenticola sp.]MCW8950118.1 DUF4124 domain-containing protein [Sedimenticola sp.]TVT59952.1 MAG: DUF4124 domain-containing protein [Sedimenticola thiotaurini]
MNRANRLFKGFLAVAALFAMQAEASKIYRWVDAEGKVHLSDKVPTEYSKNARSVLSESGREVDRVQKAKTEEEIAKEQELEKLRAEQQRLIEIQRAKDQVLLRTFRTEDDLLMARNGKLTAIDSNIHVIRGNIRRMKTRLAEMQQSAASMERQGQSLSTNLLKDIEHTRTQLKDSYTTIIQKEQEKEVIRNVAAKDLARFRSLKNLRDENADPQLTAKKDRSLLDTVVICSDDPACDKAWEKVEEYVRKYATTRLQMLSDVIIMSAAPVKDEDISLTASRIRYKDRPGAELFMDLQCKPSPRGADLCQTEQIEQIRVGFKQYLADSLNQ